MLLYLYEGMGKHGGLCFFFLIKNWIKKLFTYKKCSVLFGGGSDGEHIYMCVYICIYTYFIDVYASRLVW
jgi:hypothetical protein